MREDGGWMALVGVLCPGGDDGVPPGFAGDVDERERRRFVGIHFGQRKRM